MPGNSQDLSRGTVSTESAPAPIAFPACQADLSDNAFPQQSLTIRSDDFPDELVTRRSGETVVPAKELEVCVADPAAEKPDHRVTFRSPRCAHIAKGSAPSFKVDRKHAG